MKKNIKLIKSKKIAKTLTIIVTIISIILAASLLVNMKTIDTAGIWGPVPYLLGIFSIIAIIYWAIIIIAIIWLIHGLIVLYNKSNNKFKLTLFLIFITIIIFIILNNYNYI